MPCGWKVKPQDDGDIYSKDWLLYGLNKSGNADRKEVFLLCNVGVCVHWLVSLLHPQTDGVTNDYMRTEKKELNRNRPLQLKRL